jgi:predicted RNA-binding Zn-ribbon protein involved in translation (DUF1610 family)
LREDPRKKLGTECWSALLKNTELSELQSCRETLQVVARETDAAREALAEVVCPSCQSSLVRQRDPDNKKQSDLELYCSACGQAAELGPVLTIALGEAFWGEGHVAAMDGGEPPIDTCPECGEENLYSLRG